MPESNERGALTEAVFYILLALTKPMHGYGIMQFVKEMSNNRVILAPGTLYGALNTMVSKGWIKPIGTNEKGRKKEYVTTDLGTIIINDEMKRLDELLINAKIVMGV